MMTPYPTSNLDLSSCSIACCAFELFFVFLFFYLVFVLGCFYLPCVVPLLDTVSWFVYTAFFLVKFLQKLERVYLYGVTNLHLKKIITTCISQN